MQRHRWNLSETQTQANTCKLLSFHVVWWNDVSQRNEFTGQGHKSRIFYVHFVWFQKDFLEPNQKPWLFIHSVCTVCIVSREIWRQIVQIISITRLLGLAADYSLAKKTTCQFRSKTSNVGYFKLLLVNISSTVLFLDCVWQTLCTGIVFTESFLCSVTEFKHFQLLIWLSR